MRRRAAGVAGFPGIHVHAAHRIEHRRGRCLRHGRLHAALGIDEEGARDHDPLAGHEPFRHLDVVADARPVSTSRGSKYPLPRSTNTVLRSPESTIASAGTTSVGREVDRELHVHEHAGLERPLRVRRLEPHLQRQRRLVEDRFRRAHRRRHCAALSRRGDPRGGAAADERQLVAVHVGQNPHAVQIRDPVELEAAIEPEAGRDAALQHDAVHRRLHADVMHELAALAHLPELRVGDAHVAQRVGHPVDRLAAHGGVRRRLWLRLRLRDGHAVERLEAGVVRLLRTPELELGRDERREHLILFHGVARRDALHVPDPAAHGGDDRIRPVLVGRHAPGRPQQPGAGRAADDAEPDADRLLPLGTHLHRAGRQRRRRSVAGRCAGRAIRLEAHAADRAVAGMVAAVVRVHRAGVDGCGVRARVRRAGPVRPPRAAGERAGGEGNSESRDSDDAFHGVAYPTIDTYDCATTRSSVSAGQGNMGCSLAVPDQRSQCAEQHQSKRCGTDEFESRPPEDGQGDKFGDAGRIHELPRVAPALPVRRHLTGEFLYGGANEDHADQELQDHRCFPPEPFDACWASWRPPRARSWRVL